MPADGSADRVLPLPPGAVWQGFSGWSNDGQHVMAERGYTEESDDVRGAVVPADGSGTGVELRWPAGVTKDCCPGGEFAPDDSFILVIPIEDADSPVPQLIFDPTTGAVRALGSGTARERPVDSRLEHDQHE